jgi:hypothetical protein
MPFLLHDYTDAIDAADTLILGVFPAYNSFLIFIIKLLGSVVDFLAMNWIIYFPLADPFYTV